MESWKKYGNYLLWQQILQRRIKVHTKYDI